MAISKKLREQVRLKYNNKCAYTGKELQEGWQVDHVKSIHSHSYTVYGSYHPDKHDIKELLGEVHSINNLVPCLRIVNHYKRSLDLEGFRLRMRDFHKRLSKLPKNPYAKASIKRKEYMLSVAYAFDITPDKPFSGVFYFETL